MRPGRLAQTVITASATPGKHITGTTPLTAMWTVPTLPVSITSISNRPTDLRELCRVVWSYGLGLWNVTGPGRLVRSFFALTCMPKRMSYARQMSRRILPRLTN